MMNEILMIAGPPGGGKSSLVGPLESQGYVRANRDLIGGSLKNGGQTYQVVRDAHAQGKRSFVLDNVYGTRESRAGVIALGRELGLPVRLLWLETTAEQAQFFAARRQVQRYGHLLKPEEYKTLGKTDPNMFPPAAQFAYWKRREEPGLDEGFSAIERVPVKIDLGPGYAFAAVVFDYDGTLRTTKSGAIYPTDPDDIVLLPGRREKLQALQAAGWILLGASNQSGISREPYDPKYVSEADAVRCFQRTNDLLGVRIDCLYATERGGVPQSYWRKPLCGMGVLHIERYRLDPKLCIFVGDLGTDKTFAQRCGFRFIPAEEFFGAGEKSDGTYSKVLG